MKNAPNKPPKLALVLLYLLLPKRILDNLIGDLLEEFALLQQRTPEQAHSWFWQQSLATCVSYFRHLLTQPNTLQKLNIILPVVTFFLLLVLISWLSNISSLEHYSAGMWDRVLQGRVHTALIEPAFWQDFWFCLTRLFDLSMYIDLPALVMAAVILTTLLKLSHQLKLCACKMALWGYSLTLAPYLWALVYINSHSLLATEVGPVIAFGLLSFLYLLLPVSFIVHKKLELEINAGFTSD